MGNFRYEGERNSEYKQRIQELVEYILDRNYGETVTYQEASNILHYNIELEEENKKFKSTMLRVKNFLVDYGYILKSISGIGYYILKPKQVSSHCYRTYVKRSQKMLDKSSYVLDHVDGSELSDDRTEELNNMIQLNKALIENVWNTVKSSGYYSRKDYYNSLED